MHVPTSALRKAAAVAAAALCGLAVSAGPAGATEGWKHKPFDYYLAIGANDVDSCAGANGLDIQCGLNGIKQTAQDLPVILDTLRAAAGHKTEFVGSTYYNPFLASWLSGAAGRTTAEQSAVFLNLF